MISKEAETIMENYLKKVEKSMTEASKAKKKEILKTLRSHIMDAVEDQKGKMPETVIVKNTIKDLGVPKTESFAKKLIPWIVLTIVGLFILAIENIAGRGYTFSIPYFVCVFSAVGIWELWVHTIGERFENRRIDVIGLWLVYLVVVAELFLLGLYIAFPAIGSTSILDLVVSRGILIGSFDPTLIAELLLLRTFNVLPTIGGLSLTSMVVLIGGILVIIMSAFIIIAPGEFQSKRCPNCGKEVDGNAKFCWNCGEAIP